MQVMWDVKEDKSKTEKRFGMTNVSFEVKRPTIEAIVIKITRKEQKECRN